MQSAQPPGIDDLLPTIVAFCRDHAVKKALVFGSYARGTQTRHSDLDLMFIVDTDKRFLDRYFEVQEIHDLLQGVHVEILIYTQAELHAIAHRPFIKRILDEGMVVHG